MYAFQLLPLLGFSSADETVDTRLNKNAFPRQLAFGKRRFATQFFCRAK
nr:MAG TPA: hypothetical protein [Caudoviricetes sp.]DAY47975.1 MAG TPA: hypothetical protein [Caudoviricetes sp.]